MIHGPEVRGVKDCEAFPHSPVHARVRVRAQTVECKNLSQSFTHGKDVEASNISTAKPTEGFRLAILTSILRARARPDCAQRVGQ